METSLFHFETKGSGLVLTDSILAFDVDHTDGMGFISEPRFELTSAKQLIMSEETSALMEASRLRVNALQCQYNRPFMIGNFKLEILPSGSLLGGSSLYLESGKDSLFYAPRISLQKNLLTRKAQFKKANTLILKTHSCPHKAKLSIKKEKERLVDWVLKTKSMTGIWPVFFVPPFGTAQEVLKTLDQALIPTMVHPALAAINYVYEIRDYKVSKHGVWSKRSADDRVLIIPSPIPFGRKLKFNTSRPTAIVYDSHVKFESAQTTNQAYGAEFLMDPTPSLAELKDVIREISPKRLILFGDGAKSHAVELKTTSENIKTLYRDSQPTLF